MKQALPRKKQEHFWPKIVLRKLLNISSSRESEFAADPDDYDYDDDGDDNDAELEIEETSRWERELRDQKKKTCPNRDETEKCTPRVLRRRNSETLRAQYINSKEVRICVGTWNVGGKLPPDDLDIDGWLDVEEPSDIYVLGFQEVVPLNAGNIFGVEDDRPVPRWENIIRETLNKITSAKPKYKCYSSPSSPTRFKNSDYTPVVLDELLPETESDGDEEVNPFDDQSLSSYFDDEGCSASTSVAGPDLAIKDGEGVQESSFVKRLDRLHRLSLRDFEIMDLGKIPTKTLSRSERIGLVWPEPPLDLLGQRSLLSSNTFKAAKSFKGCSSLNSSSNASRDPSGTHLLPERNTGDIICKNKMSPFVRIISKQMVGVYISIWVRRSLRKHIQNLKVSTVGVGVMGYIGNKGSISVSMSVYQTFFCLVCSHLTAGDKEGDEAKRNADVHDIHRRTSFNSIPGLAAPKTILDHERIIWFGDLNYRIDLSYERTHEFISRKDWSGLAGKDQLKRELKKGHAFDGWTEGVIGFPPTYKYEQNSVKYVGEDPKSGRRTPAWCDRILSLGKGMRPLRYTRSELRLSDHRPVTAIFTAEVEVFSHRKLQKALSLTGSEVDGASRLCGGDLIHETQCL